MTTQNDVNRFKKGKAAFVAWLKEAEEKTRAFTFVPWLREAEKKARAFTKPKGKPEKLKEQEKETRAFSSEVASHKAELQKVTAAFSGLRSDQETSDQAKGWIDRYNRLRVVSKERLATLKSYIKIATRFESLEKYIVARVKKLKKLPRIALLFEPLKQQSDEFKEFESDVSGNRHKFESVVAHGEELIAKSKSPEIEDKIAQIRNQWDELEKEVTQYRLRLDETLKKSERFQTAHDEFDASLKEKEVAAKSLLTAGIRTDKLAKQNEKVRDFLTNLEKLEPELKAMDDLAADLCCGRSHDDEQKKCIDGMLSDHHTRYDALEGVAEHRAKNVENALRIAKKYHPAFSKFNIWLFKFQRQVEEFEPIGIVPKKIKEQMDERAAISEKLNRRKPNFEKFASSGNDLFAITGEKEVFDELTDLKNRWSKVVRLLSERQAVLAICYTKSLPFNRTYVVLDTWLVSVRDRMAPLEKTSSPSTPKAIQEKIAVVEAIQQEFSVNKSDWEKLSKEADDFASSRPENDPLKSEIKGKVCGLNDTCKETKSLVVDKAKCLQVSLAESQKAVRDLEGVVKFVKDRQKEVDSAETPDVEPEEIEKQLAKHQALSDHLNEFEPKEKKSEDCVGELVENAKPDDPLKAELEKLQKDWPQLTSAVKDRKTKLDDALAKARRFRKVHGAMSDWLNDAEKELDAMAKVCTQTEKLDEQKDTLKVFQGKVEEQKSVLDDVHAAAVQLLSDTPEDSPKRVPIDSAVKEDDDRYKKLEAKVEERQRSLDDGKDKVDRFENAKAAFVPWLKKAENKAKTFTNPEGELKKLEKRQGVLDVCFNESQIFYNVVVVIETWLVCVNERLRPETTTPTASNPTAIQGEIATVKVRCPINNN